MRCPLGGLWRLVLRGAATLGLMSCLACVSRNGTNYWAWNDPGFWAEAKCVTSQPGKAPLVRAHVADYLGLDLPGATVRFTRRSPPAVSEEEANAQGVVCASITPGHWEVEAILPGFRAARYELELPQGQTCTVEFQLWLAESSDAQTVAEKR
jgi:hypothetical protein